MGAILRIDPVNLYIKIPTGAADFSGLEDGISGISFYSVPQAPDPGLLTPEIAHVGQTIRLYLRLLNHKQGVTSFVQIP